MTPKARPHSTFKIKRLMPRNRWKFPRSNVTTYLYVLVSNDLQVLHIIVDGDSS